MNDKSDRVTTVYKGEFKRLTKELTKDRPMIGQISPKTMNHDWSKGQVSQQRSR